MLRRCLLPIVLAIASSHAQTPVITADTPVNTAMLQGWLRSGDPRLVAWAATFAMRTHDLAAVDQMPAVLDTWMLPSITARGEDNAAHRRAAMAMLDALIQSDVKVPAETIDTIAETLPDQALILLTHLPLSMSQQLLVRWSGDYRPGRSGHTLARVATMLLAKSLANASVGAQSLVAHVLTAAEEDLDIRLRNAPGVMLGLGRGIGDCGGSMGKPPAAGWPEVYAYGLNESLTRDSNSTVVELDGDRVYWVRYKENGGMGVCGGVEPLDPITRHRLLAYWMGVSPNDMQWQPQEMEVIVWSDASAYQRDLGGLVDTERARLRETVQALRQKGWLTGAEAAAVMPGLRVTVTCEMTPCPVPN